MALFTADGHRIKVEVAFSGLQGSTVVSADPNDPSITPTWTDVSTFVTAVSSDRGRTYELDQARAGSYQITFNNNDGRFDPTNTASPYFPYVLSYRAIRVSAFNASGTQFWIYTGYVLDWPQTWSQDGMFCTVTSDCIDALAILGQIYLNPAYQSEVMLDSPVSFWPMQEGSDAVNAGNLVSGGPMLQQQTLPSTGIPQGSVAAMQFGFEFGNMAGGSATAANAGDGATRGTGVNFVLDTSVSPSIGYFLSTPLSIPSVSAMTLEFWLIAGSVGEVVVLYNGRSGLDTRIVTDGFGLELDVVDPVSGSWHGISPNITLPASTRTLPASGGCHVAVSWDGTNWRVYFNGSQVGGPYHDFAPGALGGFSSISVGGRYSSSGLCLNGSMSQVALYDKALSSSRIATHAQIGLNAALGEDTAARFSRILSYAPWSGPVSVPASGDSIEGRCDTIAGQTAVQGLLDVVDDEQSNMYVAANGAVTLERRSDRYLQAAPVVTFGENPGELHYEDGVVVNYDPTLVYNSIQGARTHGATFSVQDNPSIKRYFPCSFPTSPLTLRVNDDATVQNEINFLLARYKQPFQRVGQVVFNIVGNPSQADALLSLDIGDRVRFNRRQLGRSPIALDCYIEDISHSIDSSAEALTWTISFQLSPVFPVAAVTDLRVTLKNAASSGATTMVINPLPDAAVNAAASSIPVGTQFAPVGSSTFVTVTGVSSGGPGYTSATLTFTPAFSAAHAAGQVFSDAPLISGVYDDLATLGKYPIGL